MRDGKYPQRSRSRGSGTYFRPPQYLGSDDGGRTPHRRQRSHRIASTTLPVSRHRERHRAIIASRRGATDDDNSDRITATAARQRADDDAATSSSYLCR